MVRGSVVLVLVVFLFFGTCLVNAGVRDNTSNDSHSRLSTRQITRCINIALDFLGDTLSAPDIRKTDFRVSPVIMSENWVETPIEMGVSGTESSLGILLQKIQRFSFDKVILSFKSMIVSVSSETNSSGQPILTATLTCPAIILLTDTENLDCQKQVKSRNEIFLKGFAGLLKYTTFTPKVLKKINITEDSQNILKGPGTWITNLRIDNDFRVQITGYAVDFKQITKLSNDLENAGIMAETYISQVNKNVYEKVPVWRFDMSGRF